MVKSASPGDSKGQDLKFIKSILATQINSYDSKNTITGRNTK